MKFFISAILVLSSLNALAGETLLKQCSVTLESPEGGEAQQMMLQVLVKEDGSLFSRITQTVDGTMFTREDSAKLGYSEVRAGLTADLDRSDLTPGERMIVHAMVLETDPVFNGVYKAGFDLSKVRYAKLYQVGDSGNLGTATITEGLDENKQVLGSFLGGFVVTPCE